MTRVFACMLALVVASLVATCSSNPNSGREGAAASSTGTGTFSSATLVQSLRSAGLTLTDAGMVEQPFYPVPAHVYQIEGEDLQIYEFANAAAAEQAATQVSSDGGTIGTTAMSWMAPPHFFRRDRLIINFIGTSPRAVAELTELLGAQFAGR